MARAPRFLQPDGYFHVTTRGNRQAQLFIDELDYLGCLKRLEAVTKRVGWTVLGYCLIPNHAHLLIDARVETLSKGMQLLSGWYAQQFNRKHALSGHTFQGRFFSKPADDDAHLLSIVRYVALNPVEAGLCARPQDWRWSSYAATAGLRRAPAFLAIAEARSLFGPEDEAVARLRTFVELAEADTSASP
jgi:REP element-mobilizing transposase RayT